MNELVKYDLYKSPYGVLYRVRLHSALHEPAELYIKVPGWWTQAHATIGDVVTGSGITLVARNVVFKD
ncbi:hypothetical protein [Klebsiella phage Kpn13]|uniref:Uncharacterized protein n=1 Tax=Klebsiella phage Kpn13 TaxID=3044024 RepID=A0ACD4RLN1_9CAUD|nr:hypothetical protein [Klebsiella phage Kpn13]